MPNDNEYQEAVRKLRGWRERLAARPEHSWNVDLLTHAPDEPFHYGSTVTLSAAEFGALMTMQGTLRDAFERGYRAGQYGTVPADPAGTARRVVEALLGSDEGIGDAADAVTALQAWRDEAVREARRQVLTELADELLDRRERQALSTPLTDTDELVAAVAEHYHGMHADNLTAARAVVESDVCRSVAATLQITPATWRGRRVDRADLLALLRAVPNARVSERSLIAIELDIEQPGDDDNLTRTELVDRIRNTRPGGQEVREARAQERANILGHLGININPTAAPGTQGAVRQIRNWADAQAETVERNTRANTLGAVLQQLHDELFRDSRRSEIPVPVTVPAADPAGYAGWLRDHLAQDAQQRRENLVFELGASSEQAAEITDDEELRAFLVADRQFTVVNTAHRIIRESLGHEAARAVLEADTTANTPDAVISAAVEDVTAALKDLHPHPALRRYAELRRRYSAVHDGDFRDTALALLLAPGDRLMRPIGSADGSPIFTLLEPRELWRLGPDRLADWTGPRMRIEAAALLMCAVDHGNEETTDA